MGSVVGCPFSCFFVCGVGVACFVACAACDAGDFGAVVMMIVGVSALHGDGDGGSGGGGPLNSRPSPTS